LVRAKQLANSLVYADKKLRSYSSQSGDSGSRPTAVEGTSSEQSGEEPRVHQEEAAANSEELLGKCSSLMESSKKYV